MVDIALRDQVAIFEPRGWSKLWTFRRRLLVPLAAIKAVRRAPAGVGRGWWKGWRIPGTQLPGVIVAGSYFRDGAWDFWGVRGAGELALEVDLEGAPYRRLVVDVLDPDVQVARLQDAIARRRATAARSKIP